MRHDLGKFRELQRRGMQRDCTWNRAAQQYEQVGPDALELVH
jgi:glycogen synthase